MPLANGHCPPSTGQLSGSAILCKNDHINKNAASILFTFGYLLQRRIQRFDLFRFNDISSLF